MKAEEGSDRRETFSSDVIDLSGIDLSALSTLPNSVLRAAIRRVCEELAGDGETSAYFQSSLRGGQAAGAAGPGAASPRNSRTDASDDLRREQT
jgi:FXSXX-COOH protein